VIVESSQMQSGVSVVLGLIHDPEAMTGGVVATSAICGDPVQYDGGSSVSVE